MYRSQYPTLKKVSCRNLLERYETQLEVHAARLMWAIQEPGRQLP